MQDLRLAKWKRVERARCANLSILRWQAKATKEATHSIVNCVGLFNADSRKDDYYSNNSGIGVIGSIGKPKGIGSSPICHNHNFGREIQL